MRLDRCVGWTLLVLGGSCLGADSPSVLKEKGLMRTGRILVLEAEKPVLEKMKEARAVLAEYSASAGRKDEAEQVAGDLARVEARRAELQERLNEMNQQINEQGFQQQAMAPPRQGGGGGGGNNFSQRGYLQQLIAQRDMVKANLNEISTAQTTLKSRSIDMKSLEKELTRSAEAAKALIAELRPLVDDLTKQYATLGTDPTVKAAIAGMEKTTPGSLKVSPSEAFKAGTKALEQAERRLLGKKPAAVSRRKVKARR